MIINGKDVQLIAEVKTKSPYGYESRESWEELFEMVNEYGDTVSIHTHPLWGGSFDLLEKARGLTNKKILAKGIHANDLEISEAIKRGADYVLIVGRIPTIYDSRYLIEPFTLNELAKIPKDYRVVWNSRDLATGFLKKETFEQAREIRKEWMCQASNIRTIKDVKEADAILVGEHLKEFVKSLGDKI